MWKKFRNLRSIALCVVILLAVSVSACSLNPDTALKQGGREGNISGDAVTTGPVTLLEKTTLANNGLYFWYSDPNKVAYRFARSISPRGDCFKIWNGYAFAIWFKGGMQNRNLCVSRMKLGTQKWVTIEFPETSTLYGDFVRDGIQYKGAGDSHRTAAIGISPKDNTIHLLYDMHADNLRYRVSVKGAAIVPDDQFTLGLFNAQRNYLRSGENYSSFTYPGFQLNNAGELIAQYRDGGSGDGNSMVTYYNGTEWAKSYAVFSGMDANNSVYGGISYINGRFYAGYTLRIKDNAIDYNEGLYFAKGGQRGSEGWENWNGQIKPIPITDHSVYKIAEPAPNNTFRITSAPNFTVSENGDVHFSIPVNNVVSHYYRAAGASGFSRADNCPDIDFAFGDRIYSFQLIGGKPKISSTLAGKSEWRVDYQDNGTTQYADPVTRFFNGKLYVFLAGNVNSDSRPLYCLVYNIGTVTSSSSSSSSSSKSSSSLSTVASSASSSGGPAGYTFCANEGQTVTFSQLVDVAYGANGKFTNKTGVTGAISFNNATFGDPIPNVAKKGYYKLSTVQSSSSSSTPPQNGGLKVQFYNGNKATPLNALSGSVKLINTGTTPINLESVKVRYYYTIDGEKAQTYWCDWSSIGAGNVTGTFVKMPSAKTTADYYIEVGFTAGAGTLAAGGSMEFQIRVSKNDWSNYDQTNDYSFNAAGSSYADWSKVTASISGVLKWGVEP